MDKELAKQKIQKLVDKYEIIKKEQTEYVILIGLV